MKRQIFTLLMSILFAYFSFAQKLELSKSNTPLYNASEKAHSANNTNSLVFHYCTDDIYGLSFGNYTVRVAMVIPKHLASIYAGKQITKISIGFGSIAATGTSIFIGEDLNSPTLAYTQSATLNTSSWNEVTLTTPYTISGNTDVIIGYQGTATTFIAGVDNDETFSPSEYGSFYSLLYNGSYTSWSNLANQGYYNLNIKATIEGGSFPTIDLAPISTATNFINAFPGEKVTLTTKIANNTGSVVSKFNLKQIIGTDEFETSYSDLNIGPWRTYSVSKEITTSTESLYDVTTVIHSNNAIDDISSNDTLVSKALLEISNYPTTQRNRNVILEEYTGINCQYCPDGHRRANELKKLYNGKVGVINIHQGGYAANTTPNYTTTFGDALASQTGLTGYPVGTVNRHIFSGSATALARNLWETYAPQILNSSSPVNLVAKSVIDFENRTLTVTVNGHYTGSSNANTNLLNVAVLQDSIMGPQVSGLIYYPDMVHDGLYQHNHMLRTLLTGQWGDSIKETVAGSQFSRQYTWSIPETINDIPVNLSKLEVLAFIAEGRQNIITMTPSSLTSIYFTTPNVNILSAKQLIQHSSDLKIREQISVQNVSIHPISSLEIKYTVAGVDNTNNIYTIDNLAIASGASGIIELPLFNSAGITKADLSIEILIFEIN